LDLFISKIDNCCRFTEGAFSISLGVSKPKVSLKKRGRNGRKKDEEMKETRETRVREGREVGEKEGTRTLFLGGQREDIKHFFLQRLDILFASLHVHRIELGPKSGVELVSGNGLPVQIANSPLT
jgi:hypothetical protein